MGKGAISILILAFLFIFSSEGHAHALCSSKSKEQVVKAKRQELSAKKGLLPLALKKAVIRITPAYRISSVWKDIGSGGFISLSIFSATHPHAIQSKRTLTIANSSHLFHIYPFHNFW